MPLTAGRDPDTDDVIASLVCGLASTHVGICLCDEKDEIRFVNDAFRSAVFPDLPPRPVDFVDALADGIRSGRGLKLSSMPLDAFVVQVKQRRRTGPERVDFSADMADGSWLRVSDQRLPNGWTLAIAMNISAIKDEEARLRQAHASALRASQTDWLTGLANRGCGMERAEAALREAYRTRSPLCLAILDIDHFKSINDTHGHDVGDRVLIDFAKFLNRELEGGDLSRIGGEEFLLVMPGTLPANAKTRLQRLLATPPLMERGVDDKTPLSVSFSAGLVWARRPEPLAALLGRADVALYAAKANGRGRVQLGEDVAGAA